MFQNSVFKVSVDTKKWWKAAFVRAEKTMAQTALAMLPASAMISEVDWKVDHWLWTYSRSGERNENYTGAGG